MALTLALEHSLWSNDRDFEWTGVKQFTTAQLMKLLFEKGSGEQEGPR